MSSNWLSFYSDPTRSRHVLPKLYNSLSSTSKTFQERIVPDCLEALFNEPNLPLAYICANEAKLSVYLAHHPTFLPSDQGSPRKATQVFALLGHKEPSPVILITLDDIKYKATPGASITTPSEEDLLSYELFKRPNTEELLALPTDDGHPLSVGTCMPIPPLAVEAIANHGPHNIEGILISLLSTLATWPDQFDKQVPTDKLIQSCFPFIQLLWWGVRLTTTKPSKPELSILHQLPKAPVTLESNTIPEDVTLDLLEATKLAGITAAASTPAISTPRTDDDSDVDSDEDPKNQPPIDLNNNNQLRSMLATLMTSVAQITKVHAKKDKLAANRERRHAEETKRRDEERKRVDENQRLLIEQKYKSGESSSTGFSKLLPENQLMIRRLAACIDGVVPANPSEFHTNFFASKKDVAHSILQQACERFNPEFVVGKGITLRTLTADIPASNRDSSLKISLLNFTSPTVPIHSTDDYCERQLLANNNVEGSTLKKIASDITWEFPADGNALVRGLHKYAAYFDVLAGLSPKSDEPTLIGTKIRSLANLLGLRIDKMQTLQNQDPDALAQLANAIDTKINLYILHCAQDAQFEPSRLDSLSSIDGSLDQGFTSTFCTIPSFLLGNLPSRRLAHKRLADQRAAGSPTPKHIKAAEEKDEKENSFKPRTNLNKLELPAGHSFNTIFLPNSFCRCPKIKVGNKYGRPCLNYYCKGACAYRNCNHIHGPLHPQDKVKLEAFIVAQAANPNGDANQPAAANEDES